MTASEHPAPGGAVGPGEAASPGARLFPLFRSAPIGMALSRVEDGRFLDANERYCDIVGRTRAELVGRSSVELAMFPDRASREAAIDGLRSAGVVRDRDIVLRRKDGALLTLSSNLDRVRVDGEACILTWIVDVTQRRRDEAELRAKNEALEDFAYLASHDLKEPVRTMNILLATAEEHAVAPATRDAVRLARESNERLARILVGLLEIANAARVDPRDLRAVDVAATLRSDACAERFGRLARERGAEVELVGDAAAPRALATDAHLAQVLGNLVTNAIRHNAAQPPRVLVRVSPAADGKRVRVAVEDNGAGFDPRVLASGGARVGAARGATSGFGLAIVRRAVERLGGSMTLGASEALGGASVVVELPASRADIT